MNIFPNLLFYILGFFGSPNHQNKQFYLFHFFFLTQKMIQSPPAGFRTSKAPPAAQSIKN